MKQKKKAASVEPGRFVRIQKNSIAIQKPKKSKSEPPKVTHQNDSNNISRAQQKRNKKKLQKSSSVDVQANSNEKHQKKSNKNRKIDQNSTDDFRGQLVDQLKSSRFRFINELLYTRSGSEAGSIFKEDSEAFTTYHEGYQKQVEQWPLNPLDRIIKSIKNL